MPAAHTPPTARRGNSLAAISHRLTPRDHTIAHLLDDHTALSTQQLATIAFDSPHTCRNRLHTLRRLHYIDRIHRLINGARLTLWVPGLLSARLVALARGHTPPTPRAVALRQDTTLASPTAAHTIEVNQFFTDLIAHARRNPATELTRWWSERHTTAAYANRIRPDGHGIWHHHTRSVGFFLEHDRGTEPHHRLTAKLQPYQRLQAAGGPAYPILFSFPTRTRERHFHRHLADTAHHDPQLAATLGQLTVATSARDHTTNPADPVWRLVGNRGHRLPLADLPSHHGQPGPINPGR